MIARTVNVHGVADVEIRIGDDWCSIDLYDHSDRNGASNAVVLYSDQIMNIMRSMRDKIEYALAEVDEN